MAVRATVVMTRLSKAALEEYNDNTDHGNLLQRQIVLATNELLHKIIDRWDTQLAERIWSADRMRRFDQPTAMAAFNKLLVKASMNELEHRPALAAFHSILAKSKADEELEQRPAMETYTTLLATAKTNALAKEVGAVHQPAMAAFNALLAKAKSGE
jgi:hypothetical protein